MVKRSAKDLDRHIGSRIRLIRRLKGLNLEQAGAIIDVSQQQFSRYELGENRLSAAQLFTLSSELDVPLAWFYEHWPAKDDSQNEAESYEIRESPSTFQRHSQSDQDKALLLAWNALPNPQQKQKLLEFLESLVFSKR